MAGLVDITPTADSVALLISSRTIGPGGSELGTFSDQTHPTASQISQLCDVAAQDVLMGLGIEDGTLPDELADEGRTCATLRAAQLAELSFYPEAAATESRLATLTATYLTSVANLSERLHWTAVRLA